MTDSVVCFPSDDPPDFKDESRTCLFIRGTWDFAIAVGPKGRYPLHWVALRTSGGSDEFMNCLVAAAFWHLKGKREQALACALNASRQPAWVFERAEDWRERWLADTEGSTNTGLDSMVRQSPASICRETWEAVGRANGWLDPPPAAG